MASEKPPNESNIPANDRLVNTIERCFSELIQKQQDQSDRFHEALQALKPKPPTTDTKTAFWNAYKTLADEHDKELQQKYSTDLDTALIFAGLFSAVDSAFIIQIQPAIQPRGTPLVILVAQNLLYVSLFSTLLAALLAVLGKQWLMHYTAAGERGTIEARGLERQRKLDGLRKWKFDSVMQIFPLLLQIGLFLFSAALSIYLWSIHLSLAIIVLFFTSIGSIAYTALLMSAVAFPDSPFQTPLAPLVARLIPRTLSMKSKIFLAQVTVQPRIILQRACAEARRIRQAHNLLPFFKNSAPLETMEGPSLDVVFEEPFPTPSPEVPAVSWVLEMSTDPRTVAVAAEMVINLQWPAGMDVRPQISKLHDGILSSFYAVRQPESESLELWSTRDGMSANAMHLGRAYCTLRCVFGSNHPGWQEFWCFEHSRGYEDALNDDDDATRWAFSVISTQGWVKQQDLYNFLGDFDLVQPVPTLDIAGLADYLFSVAAFLSQTWNGLERQEAVRDRVVGTPIRRIGVEYSKSSDINGHCSQHYNCDRSNRSTYGFGTL
ncbi:hypothetical protein DFH06DRAFT_373025 [Mycena polygramma]|nr:hypothetical protein DFH06DRAFT_373025 [Mycena polygramma]